MIQNPTLPKADSNAVKIEIINPTVNAAPTPAPASIPVANSQAMPQYYYGYPQSSIYNPNGQPFPAIIMSHPVIITKPVIISTNPKNKSTEVLNDKNIAQAQIVSTDEVKTNPTPKALNSGEKTQYIKVPEQKAENKPVIVVVPAVPRPSVEKNSKAIVLPNNTSTESTKNNEKIKSEPITKEETAKATPISNETIEKKAEPQVISAPAQSDAKLSEVNTKEIKPEQVVINNFVNNVDVKRPEIVPAEPVLPKIDVDSFCKRLSSTNFEEQFEVMKEIKDLVQKYPPDAIGAALVDKKIFTKLDEILHADSSLLAGPSKTQVNARVKLMAGKSITPEEKELAESLSPKEYAEHNKSIAMFTMASLDKLLIEILKNEDHLNVPLVDIPYANTIADIIKDNPNPIVRASAIESLSWIQQPEYKDELKAIFTAATKDKNPEVSSTAQKALDNLNKMK